MRGRERERERERERGSGQARERMLKILYMAAATHQEEDIMLMNEISKHFLNRLRKVLGKGVR